MNQTNILSTYVVVLMSHTFNAFYSSRVKLHRNISKAQTPIPKHVS